MTDDRGLSIFEETAEAEEPTQVIPRVEPESPEPEKPAAASAVPAQKPVPA